MDQALMGDLKEEIMVIGQVVDKEGEVMEMTLGIWLITHHKEENERHVSRNDLRVSIKSVSDVNESDVSVINASMMNASDDSVSEVIQDDQHGKAVDHLLEEGEVVHRVARVIRTRGITRHYLQWRSRSGSYRDLVRSY